jgi:hypothetical protein
VSTEFEFDGYTYRLEKLGTRAALDCLKYLQQEVKFFDEGLSALMVADHEALERRLFRENALLLNDTGDWVPLGKDLVAGHFNGRTEAYFALLVKQIKYNFEGFLAGGWTTSLSMDGNDQDDAPLT